MFKTIIRMNLFIVQKKTRYFITLLLFSSILFFYVLHLHKINILEKKIRIVNEQIQRQRQTYERLHSEYITITNDLGSLDNFATSHQMCPVTPEEIEFL